MKTLTLILAVLLLSVAAFAGENDDAQAAFCKYVQEQASAQRDILRTPSAVVGPIQPSTGTAPQLVFGLSSSIADMRKAGLTMKAARTTCDLYRASVEAEQHIQYAFPLIEKEILRHRLDLIDQATQELNAQMADEEKMVAAQNLTRPAVYSLQEARLRLDMSRTAALTGITSPYVPTLSDTPLRELIGDKLATEEANQTAVARLQKQNGWDLQLTGGAHRQIGDLTPTTKTTGVYTTFSLTYNLSRHSANEHLDKSVSAYVDWKKTQFDDVAHQAIILKKQIEETIVIQEGQLKVLLDHQAQLQKDLDSLEGVETSNALAFRNQLVASKTVLRVDVQDVQFRLSRLRQYLTDNF